jgi:cobyrinic acid a,c-diamide synthase
MFHRTVLGTPGGNLDPFFVEKPLLRALLQKRESSSALTVLEGAMGYYDGIGFTDRCSAWAVANDTDTPAVLVVDCKGMGHSVLAVVEGFLRHKERSCIKGVFFNRMAPSLYPKAAEAVKALGILPLGFLSVQKNWSLQSRHLGLITADEIDDLQQQLDTLAAALEQTADIDGLLALANTAAPITDGVSYPVEKKGSGLRIGVADDRAFSFTYADNLTLLRDMGCDLCFFSPLVDDQLPERLDGLILSGGYPELYAKALSQNESMRRSVRSAIEQGMPCIAECGGFLYLHQYLEGADGVCYPMVGAVEGTCKNGGRLRRFGYIHLHAQEDQLLCAKGDTLKGHEFHYWQRDRDGTAFQVEKASGSGNWQCGVATPSLYGGFPHFYFYGNPGMAERFVERCRQYGMANTTTDHHTP